MDTTIDIDVFYLLENNTQKAKDCATPTSLISGVNYSPLERLAVPAPLVAPVMLLLFIVDGYYLFS